MEAAVLRTVGPDQEAGGPEERARLKRLLDLDRKRPTGQRLFDERYAFYSTEAPGTGHEVLFSSYEVFALWVGLKLLAGGLPQGRVVFLMRYHRAALEREHVRITAVDRAVLFARSESLTENAGTDHRETLVREGRLVEHIDDMTFLAVQADSDSRMVTKRTLRDGRPTNIVQGGDELLRFMELAGFARHTVLLVELANPAYRLDYWLTQTPPARRGRR
ncbi:hypothetical protein AB4Y85_04700 [Microvirga sp. 2YAF29]|uniref:hypothetical protein n=1 Tax=Microvirga sp. 2YAF29 TaxID=3233031 RepID=UPI003F9AC34B